jgi:hypothetical protein
MVYFQGKAGDIVVAMTGGWEVVFSVRCFFCTQGIKRQIKRDLPQNLMCYLDISAKMRTFAGIIKMRKDSELLQKIMDCDSVKVTSPLLPPLDDFIESLRDIWGRKWVTNNGLYHRQLEQALAEYLKVPYISLFTNGTLPLLTALQALDIKGEVIS